MASTWRKKLGRWVSGERATTSAIDFNTQIGQFFGPGIGNQPDFDVLLRESRGIFHRTKMTLANRVADLEPLVKIKQRRREGTIAEEILDDHPAKALLDKPHPNRTRRECLFLTVCWLVDAGEAYWLKVGNGLGIPSELHLAKPGALWPIVKRGVISHYEARDGAGQIHRVETDAVVRFHLPDPENPWGSEGMLAPLGIPVDSLKFSGETLRHHYQHDATPKAFLEALESATPPDTEQLEAFLEWWRTAYHRRTGDKAGLPGFGPSGFRLVQLAMQSGADMTPLLEFWREDILMGMGTSKTMLGLVESGDRSAAETLQWIYDLHTVKPITDLLADALTMQLARDFDEKLIVEFEDFVAPDKEYQLRREQHDLSHGVRTINKVLRDREDDEVPWGDKPFRLQKLQSFDVLDAPDANHIGGAGDGETDSVAPQDTSGDSEPTNVGESADEDRTRALVNRKRRARSRRRKRVA